MTRPAWTPELLDGLRLVGDPVVDAAIAELVNDRPAPTARSVMERLIETMEPGDEDPTPLLQAFLDETDALPSWHDPELMRRGQAFFADWGLPIASALFCASLPVAYASADGANVISITGELVSTTRRRIAETAQMIVAVMDLDLGGGAVAQYPLAWGTRGFSSARGVRLMHAAVRFYIGNDPDASQRYERDQWGVPVNQEDLLGTLLTFTTVVVDALYRLGITCSQEESEAYLHTWCVVGHLLGIREDLLPLGWDEAVALEKMIRQRHERAGVAGPILMDALLEEMRSNMPRGLGQLPAAIVRRVVGRTTADVLEVPTGGWTRALLLPLEAGARFWSRRPMRQIVGIGGRMISRRMIKAYVTRARTGRPAWEFHELLKPAPVLRTRARRAGRAVARAVSHAGIRRDAG